MGTFEFFRWRESERLSGTGQAVVRPIVDVTLTRGDLDIRTPALIDTGAPKTLFPRGAADVLDIEFPLKSAPNVRQHDILGRRWPAVTELVSMSLDSVPGLVWEAEVDFLALLTLVWVG